MVSLAAKEAMLGCIGKRDRWCSEFHEFRSLAFKKNCNEAAGAHRFSGSVEFDCIVYIAKWEC